MAQVTVTINNRGYQIACDDGQEQHLVKLAGYVDKRVGELTAAMGQIGDMRLLVMASLLIADELADARKANEQQQKSLEDEKKKKTNLTPEAEEALAQGIETLALKIEEIAARLEAA
jgi:cell division protein ZapA